ncbi:major capsid protein [Herbaspirillum sp. alder98]|uniref:major capsid protein n=1 Tax=Herbaspirillum sp. alder98 TaxID=2913096 RepID=UPI001CD85101|nr:major capsid protein [Herbaspirillum sp. alder98]MCA1323756.1 major capsid protein [Herbaspirillum sp. alder98]
MQVNKAKKLAGAAVTGVALAVGAAPAANAATTVDLTAITGAISSADIVTGVLAIGAVMAVVYVTVKAAKMVMSFLKSA